MNNQFSKNATQNAFNHQFRKLALCKPEHE